MKQPATPHWWPENEPWPPRSGPFAWRRRRSHFTRRVGGIVAIGLFLLTVGLTTVISWIVPGITGGSLRPTRLLMGMIWIFVVFRVFQRLMGRFGLPLGDIVETANRAAEGDYSARARESGPRWLQEVARAFNSMTSKLQAQDKQRRELMADIAHELRTPLAVLQGRLEGMLDGVYPRDEAQITAVLQETRMLTRLVEDLRTLAHSESGTLALQKEPTDLAILLHDAAAAFSAEATTRSVSLRVTVAPDLPLLDVDPLRIREVLTNLLSNAIRHTPPGGTVALEGVRRAASIAVSVSDTGTGIPAADLSKIFDRFYKGHDSGGSGLGLTIARNLVVAHGGEIRAESAEGKGTTITFLLAGS